MSRHSLEVVVRERTDGVAVVADLGDGLGPPVDHHERVGSAAHAHAGHRSTGGRSF